MDKKESRFMVWWFHGWFWVPTEGWKETAPWKRKFRFSVKANMYMKPCICLKSKNVNIENEGANGKNFFEFLKSCILKWEEKMDWE